MLTPNIDVAKAIRRLFITPEGRTLLQTFGGHSAMVIACRPEDTVQRIIERARQTENDGAIVAFLDDGQPRVLTVRPIMGAADGGLEHQAVGNETTISMLYHVAAKTGETRFHLGGVWERDNIASVPDLTAA